ncbi:MAG: hypothetical protein ACJ735_09585 [Actinomycetes bacterium]
MNARRWLQRAAFAGAAGLTAVTFWPIGSAGAAATPPTIYSMNADAAGINYTVDKNPGLAAVQGIAQASLPRADSTLLAGGSSAALADAAYPGTAQGVPDLLCGQVSLPDQFPPPLRQPCDTIDTPAPDAIGFPPKQPVEASAQNPTQTDDKATLNGPTIGGHGAVTAAVGTIEAHAHDTSSSGIAHLGSTLLGPSAAAQVRTGAVHTTTNTVVDSKGRVVSTADSLVQDITVLAAIHIGSVHSMAQVINDGHHAPVVNTSTTVSGVTVGGQQAAIDQNGIRIVSADDKGKSLKTVNEQLAQLFAQDGISFKVLQPFVSRDNAHSASTRAGGLVITFSFPLQQPIHPNTPPIPGCIWPLPPAIPANPCTGVQEDPNGLYFGTVNIASAGVQNTGSFFSFTFNPGGIGPLGPTTTGTGPTTTFTPGTAGTPGTPGTAGTPGSPSVAPPGGGQNSQLGSNPVGFVENLGDVAGRLKYLFPALLLAVIGVLAGRIGRAPARLPAQP